MVVLMQIIDREENAHVTLAVQQVIQGGIFTLLSASNYGNEAKGRREEGNFITKSGCCGYAGRI